MAGVNGLLTTPSVECPHGSATLIPPGLPHLCAIDFDPVKIDEILAERGFDLAYVARVFPGIVLERQDTRRYNETRYQVIAEHHGTIFVLVYTRRGSVCRLITAWEADPDEIAIWYDVNS